MSRIVKVSMVVILIGILAACAGQTDSQAPSGNPPEQASSLSSSHAAPSSYEAYRLRYRNAGLPQGTIRIQAVDYDEAVGEMPRAIAHMDGAPGEVLWTPEDGMVSWEVEVREEGLYELALRYFPAEGTGSSIERALLINGELPFDEAGRLVLTRVWGNSLPNMEQDTRGNDLRTRQIEVPQWQQALAKDSEGYYEQPFALYLPEGTHTIALDSLKEPLILDYLELRPETKLPAYADKVQHYKQSGYSSPSQVYVKVQGEEATLKSSPSLFPIQDRSSPGTEPYHPSKIRLNTIGGGHWKVPGQWLQWEVEIPEDGLYELGMRYKQNLVRGVNVVRRLYLDGEIPFQEAVALPFPYGGTWQTAVTGENGTSYLYYLTKGKHQLKLELSMGSLSDVIRMVRSSIQELNALYLKVITLTGTVPDPYRDYQLEASIPDMAAIFLRESSQLRLAAGQLDDMVGGTSSSTAILRSTAYQLEDMAARPETVTSRLSQFKDNVSSLGTWLLTVNEQPLEIDYLFFKSPDVPVPAANPPMWRKLAHEANAFWNSFFENYNDVNTAEASEHAVKVWITSGRDQAQLLRSMINSTFTPETGIAVDLQLVAPEVVLPATLAGEGPDIALSMGGVVNFAMRNALQDLTVFRDYDEVYNRFMDSAFTGFRFRDGVYAIPETQAFPMLFYRKDILGQLELSVPDTWEQLYRIIPELQKHNMQLAMPHVPAYEMLLYQGNGAYYVGDGIAAGIDSEAGTASFRKWTELYTNYKLPIEYDFINRFRIGEMPIGIADYTMFNFLTIFAPEIRGQWDFTVLPGTAGADGTVHREALSTATGTVMFKDARNKDNAWAFIKWWTDTEAQVSFGREMEAILGESARYPAANLEALRRLPWSSQAYNSLLSQLQWVVGRPDVPGGYMMDRHLLNAFYEVYNNAADAREALKRYVKTINEELALKREEFGLPTR